MLLWISFQKIKNIFKNMTDQKYFA